jgi:predicted negative regulator of RcsB-dependent stress response
MSNNKDLRAAAMKKKPEVVAEEENGKFFEFTKKNTRIILGVFAIIVVAIVGVKLINDSKAKKIEESSVAYYRAEKFFNTGEFEIALNGSTEFTVRGNSIKGFKKIADEYSSTPAGKTAAFKAGLCYLKSATPDQAAARSYFEKAKKADDAVILTGAYANIAALDETEGKFDAAAKGYLTAADKAVDDETKCRYTYFAGLAYEAAGNPAEAGNLYKGILKDYKTVTFADQAKIGLLRLGTEIE